MHWKDIAIERAEREYDQQMEAERIEREQAEEAEAVRLADLADLAETGCTPQEIEEAAVVIDGERLIEQLREGRGYLDRIERRPVQLVNTMQGNLFPKEVA